MGGDDQAAGMAAGEADTEPGETAKQLGAIQEEDLVRSQTAEPPYPSLLLAERKGPDPEASISQPDGELFQKRGLAPAVGTDDRGAVAEGGEAVEEVFPGQLRGKPVAELLHPMRGEGVVPRPHGRTRISNSSSESGQLAISSRALMLQTTLLFCDAKDGRVSDGTAKLMEPESIW